jgi:hypothetical protein
MYRKKTLRNMAPTVRKVAMIINHLDSAIHRLKNLTDDIARLEFDSKALYNRLNAERPTETDTAPLFHEEAHDEL